MDTKSKMSEELIEPIATRESSKKISAINKETVHHICSGQVVLDLAVAVKELVENSIDSGATVIDVQLVDYGKTCITVSDNGSGVLEQDFEGLALKHHTSKLREFSDLQEVVTFGFRGEALSSLCALSDLSITTRHSTNDHAFKLQFDKNGVLVNKEICAREFGTTVVVKNIFKNLPVRAKEFQKNIKKEYAKTIQILYSYCLVSTGIKIRCTNNSNGKANQTLISTMGSNSVLENAESIFGRKSLAGLSEVKIEPPDETTLQEYNLPATLKIDFSWEFYVSSCEHTMGRSSADRQFFYVNGRPCHLTKISKLINNIYHKYNNKQYPFVYLNLKPDQQCADVNVTPDKRTIFLTQEKFVLATIKSNLVNSWDKMQGNFTMKTLQELNYTLKRSVPRNNSGSPNPPTKKLALEKQNEGFPTQKDDENVDNEKENLVEKLKDRDLRISLESIKRCILQKSCSAQSSEKESQRVKYRVQIEPSKSAEAEKELKKELKKESFGEMAIVGQFNLGFIVARLQGDLFIIDQHATDEKFRFEKLNDETKLKTQKLIIPKSLNLAALNESILVEHRQIFEDNGFTFDVNENENPGSRVRLTGMPTSGGWQFGQEDIEELIFLIREGASDNSGTADTIPRPSRVRQMLASRACRGAVMIGKALNMSEMRRLLWQMGEMKNPWNCPHGRPTISQSEQWKLQCQGTVDASEVP
ncbi:mismatch repair endonuclease PMS2 isoform X2 [Venturia canescens]|uniref:mismatch repair endonuclease PMS2 isoform X2 n=1 Tax=Venturia canescens TaxID=32260 RepID=UPI001C9C580B|nr:mismatch repair endonuclease PMS2 isoform X2 [Venturia canescens]